MNASPTTCRKSIVMGVTSAQSLRLMEGFPDYLASRGWEVHVVCSGAPPVSHDAWFLHSIPMCRHPSPLKDTVSLGRWVSLLLEVRPTVVAVGTPKAGFLGTIAAALTRRPCRIYMLRGLRLSTTQQPLRGLLYSLERLAMSAATSIHAISRSLADEASSLGLAPPAKFTVLGSGSSNGVPVTPAEELPIDKKTRRLELGLLDVPTVGFVGRLHPDKGIDVLLQAIRLLDSAIHKQLLIIGPEEEPGYLDRLLDLYQVDRSMVKWVGSVKEPAVYYPAMTVLSLPTKREGFGNVIIEAAAYGVPTIASRVTGCVDAVVDGVTGRLVPPDDPSALATALEHALSDKKTLSDLGKAARSRVEDEFGRERVWELTERFYTAQLLKAGA